ncbi:MAG: hypothetical protein ACFE9S_16490 [Candidatus Hermodarchaeota archaeon]
MSFFESIVESFQNIDLESYIGGPLAILNIYNSQIMKSLKKNADGGLQILDSLDLTALRRLGHLKPLRNYYGTLINTEEYWKKSVAELRLRELDIHTDYLIEFSFLIPHGFSNTIQFFIGLTLKDTFTTPVNYEEDWTQYSRYILLSTGENTSFNIFFVPDHDSLVLLKDVNWGVVE